jgi:hypothetical protein
MFVQNKQVERRHMSASEEPAGSSTAYSPTGSIAEVGSSDSPFLPWYVPHHHHDPALAQCKLKMKRDGRRGRRQLACWEAEQETQSLSSTSGTLTCDKHWQHNTVLYLNLNALKRVYHVSLPLVKDDNATKPIPRPTAF